MKNSLTRLLDLVTSPPAGRAQHHEPAGLLRHQGAEQLDARLIQPAEGLYLLACAGSEIIHAHPAPYQGHWRSPATTGLELERPTSTKPTQTGARYRA